MCLLPALTGLSRYDTFAEWQAAVGSHRLEDFESLPEMRLPADGGQLDLPRFLIEADAQHGDFSPGEIGVRDGSWINGSGEPQQPSSMVFVGNTNDELGSFDPIGPTLNRFVFPKPITAFGFEVSYSENPTVEVIYGENRDALFRNAAGDPYFFGVVLDRPVDRIRFHSGYNWYHIDSVRWATTPEPSSFLVFCVGLAVLRGSLSHSRRRS